MSFDLVPEASNVPTLNLSSWEWRPLVFYAWMLYPRRVGPGWHFNDGERVSAVDASELANRIDAELASGRAVEFVQIYNKTCDAANGTVAMYPLYLDLLQRFRTFARQSGGFRIE